MAAAVIRDVAVSNILSKNTAITEEKICSKCYDSEMQLKEALSELSSAQMIISILQKELISATASTSASGNAGKSYGEPDKEVWKTVMNNSNKNGKYRKTIKPPGNEPAQTKHSVSSTNRFSPLSNLTRDDCVLTQRRIKTKDTCAVPKQDDSYNKTLHQAKMKNNQGIQRIEKVKSKITVIGDSHARNCTQLIQDNFSADFRVTSVVKPGAGMEEVTNSLQEELKTLNGNDFVVVWGGAKHIRKNNMKEVLKSVCKFVKENSDLNIVLIDSPHRYDMIPESCVNLEVLKFNRQV